MRTFIVLYLMIFFKEQLIESNYEQKRTFFSLLPKTSLKRKLISERENYHIFIYKKLLFVNFSKERDKEEILKILFSTR